MKKYFVALGFEMQRQNIYTLGPSKIQTLIIGKRWTQHEMQRRSNSGYATRLYEKLYHQFLFMYLCQKEKRCSLGEGTWFLQADVIRLVEIKNLYKYDEIQFHSSKYKCRPNNDGESYCIQLEGGIFFPKHYTSFCDHLF